MELSATSVPVELNVEEIRKQAHLQWLSNTVIRGIFADHKGLEISQRQERPTSGSIFVVKLQRLREFKKDGHVWSKKKDGKTIQESHVKLKVDNAKKLNCLYTYGKDNENFKRRIYRMDDEELALFHYLEEQENGKNYKRGKKTTKVTTQSTQEAGKAIPTLVVTGSQGSSSGYLYHGSNQLSLPPQTTDISSLKNIQGNVAYAGSSSGNVYYGNNQLPLPQQTSDIRNLKKIQGNFEYADYDCEFENQSFPPETENDFPPNPGTPGGPCELLESTKSMDQCSKSNKKNLKRGSEIPGQLLANSSGEFQDCMIFQQNPDSQENWKNCKRPKKLNNLELTGSPSGMVHHHGHQLALSSQTTYTSNLNNIQGYAKSGDGMHFLRVVENDFPPNTGILGRPSELPELLKAVEQFSESCIPVVDPVDYSGDRASESVRIRFENMLSLSSVHSSCLHSNISQIQGLINKLKSLQKETPEEEISLKEKLHSWLLGKVAEGGGGLTVLDEGGQGLIHLAAAIGYDWALEAIIVAIDINFSDKNEWTALHWAAYCGRKNTVEYLLSNGAATGLPSIPTPNYPGGNTAADLAFAAGHEEIGACLEEKVLLAERALELHLDEFFDS